jgi:uncharacterized LabA/DUF88 family protein
MVEPDIKRVEFFIDGQNLFKGAEEAFGYNFPNYSPMRLATRICQDRPGWNLGDIHFYTGIPARDKDPKWNQFWAAKLLKMSRRGIKTYGRPLRYRRKEIKLAGGVSISTDVAEEKGIDVRIALDVIRQALRETYDVAVIISQDQDFSEVASEIRVIAAEQDRWIKVASAFVDGNPNFRGIQGTDWIRITREVYDACSRGLRYATPLQRP